MTGSRQVSQLAVQAYKQLETADANIADLTRNLGREVTEVAVLRAITELWQQLRIIPVILAPGQAAEWQLLRQRFQKAIAEGASTSQVTAISVLASIYLQAVIAATMEEVELFLSPLTARSKVREVLRGLVATRQVHTIPLGHSPHFYVAGTLPEFAAPPTIYSSSSMPASAYFMHSRELDEEVAEPVVSLKPLEAEAPVASAAPHKGRRNSCAAACRRAQAGSGWETRRRTAAFQPPGSSQPRPQAGTGRHGQPSGAAHFFGFPARKRFPACNRHTAQWQR